MKQPNEFTFYSDSSHGWLEVPISLCRELGLQGKISGYSYVYGEKIYLEEDCDASLFVDAYCKKADISWDDFVRSNKRVRHDRSPYEESPVRRFTGAVPSDLLKS